MSHRRYARRKPSSEASCPYVVLRHYHPHWEGILIGAVVMLTLITGLSGAGRPVNDQVVLQLRVVVATKTATCPGSVSNPSPTRAVTLRDPYHARCDRLGPAGFVLGTAPASVLGSDPSMVKVSLTPSQSETYQSFMLHHQGATIAAVAFGAIQSALPTLDLFSGKPTFLVVTVRNQSVAEQLVKALSGLVHRQSMDVLQVRPVITSSWAICPQSEQDAVPSSPLRLRDPDGECDLLGPAGLVINHAPAVVSVGSPPTVAVELTPDNGKTYIHFLALHRESRIAFYALGVIQWATRMTSFFKGSQPVLAIIVRSASAANQLVRALSD